MRLILMKCLNFKKMSKRNKDIIIINTSMVIIAHMITVMMAINMEMQRMMIMKRKIDSKYKIKMN